MRPGADMSRAQAAELVEKRIVAGLAQEGSLSFGQIRHRLLPNTHVKDVDNAIRRLRTNGIIRVSDGHPRLWSIAEPVDDAIEPAAKAS